MIRATRWLSGAIVFLCLTATSAVAQSITGPGKDLKSPGAGDPGVSALDAEWTSWSEDELVARVVQQPVKIIDLEDLEPEALLELKQFMGRAEVRVRAVMGSLTGGSVDLPTARSALEAVLHEYRGLLDELTER